MTAARTRFALSLAAACALVGTVALSCGVEPTGDGAPAEAAAGEEVLAGVDVTFADAGVLMDVSRPDGRGPLERFVEGGGDASGADASEPAPDPDAECVRDSDCGDGIFCNGFEVCGPSQRCVPGRPIECPAMLPFCDDDMDTCVCMPGSCPAPSTCDGFSCW